MSDDLTFQGEVEASTTFTITDPVALVQKFEDEWLALGEPGGEIDKGRYRPWERFAVFVYNLMMDNIDGITLYHLDGVKEGYDHFEVDFHWTEEMAERLNEALPKDLRTDHDPNAEPDPKEFEPGPNDIPIPGLEP